MIMYTIIQGRRAHHSGRRNRQNVSYYMLLAFHSRLLLERSSEPVILNPTTTTRAPLYWIDRRELQLGNTLNMRHLVGVTPAAESKLGYQIFAQSFGQAVGVRSDK